MAAENGFTIDGKIYEVPSLDTFTIDEAQLLYDYSGLSIEDFVDMDEDADELDPRLKNPGFLRTLLHVAYQRAHPHLATKKVAKVIGEANVLASMEHMESQGDDAGPPASTTEHDDSSLRSSVGSSESSGIPSEPDSGGQVVLLPATTGGSLPPSESPPTVSAG